MRKLIIEALLKIALKLARHPDVHACLDMTLRDVQAWHRGYPGYYSAPITVAVDSSDVLDAMDKVNVQLDALERAMGSAK